MRSNPISLSVLVPVYNEQHLVAESVNRLLLLAECEFLSSIQEIVVDDGSTDLTHQVLDEYARARIPSTDQTAADKMSWSFHRHPRNLGKGAASRTAIGMATGEISVVH